MAQGGTQPPFPAPPAAPPARKKIATLIIVAVIVVALLAGVAYFLLSAPAPSLDRVELSAAKTRIDQREALVVTAAAVDKAGSNRGADAAFAWSATPSARAQVAEQFADDSRADLVALQAGIVNVSATASLGGVTKTGYLDITIDALQFEITSSDSSPLIGSTVTLTVRVLRGAVVATSYLGTVNFTSDDGLATLPPNTAFTSSDAGSRTFPGVIIRRSGSVTITARDTVAAIIGTVGLTGRRPANAPIATFTVARTLMQVNVDASASTDPDSDISTYTWFWGDGQTTAASASPTATHTYGTPNAYTIRLLVTDLLSNQDNATNRVTVGASTIDFSYWDFFNVPWGQWWDMRTGTYGDLPVNAECFNATSITAGLCTANDPSVDDVSSYPYTNWWPAPGAVQPGNPNNNPFIYAPYRFSATGDDVPGYNRSEPVFLPILDYSAPPGNELQFSWRYQYLSHAAALARRAAGCPAPTNINIRDGYEGQSWINLTMDLQQSRRMFGVVATDATTAQAWWVSQLNTVCFPLTPFEFLVDEFFYNNGNGKYDIYNSFEYFYSPFYTNVSATVDSDGTTHVSIEHVSWGTEVLLSRMFYWGNASYAANYLDSTKAKGWWGMELAWFEDLTFTGSLGAVGFDFTLTSAMNYHFQIGALPGPNGVYDPYTGGPATGDDVPVWSWGPWLTDYTFVGAPVAPYSEINRYPDPEYNYTHSTPGSRPYGVNKSYDYTPITWDLDAGQSWHFEFPATAVVFYDPNNTPIGTDPIGGGYAEMAEPLKLRATNHASYGTWDPVAFTWDVLGPATTGGPEGSPGPDGTPGTADDRYPTDPWGSITFAPASATGSPPAVGSPGADQDADVSGASAVLSSATDGFEASAAPVRERSSGTRFDD